MKHSVAVWFQYICEVIRFVHYRLFTAAVDCDFKFLLRNMIFALYPGWSISSHCLASCWGFMWICWHQLWAFTADGGLRARMELTEQYISSRKTHNIVPLHSWTIEQCVWKFVVVVVVSFFLCHRFRCFLSPVLEFLSLFCSLFLKQKQPCPQLDIKPFPLRISETSKCRTPSESRKVVWALQILRKCPTIINEKYSQ